MAEALAQNLEAAKAEIEAKDSQISELQSEVIGKIQTITELTQGNHQLDELTKKFQAREKKLSE